MAAPLDSSKPLSPEEFVDLYQRNGCHKCGAEGSSGQRFMVCGGCEGPSYCSKECQRADWPAHKPVCKQNQATKAKLQAKGVGEHGQQLDDWAKHRKVLIALMINAMLGKRARTHVLRITVDHQPRSNPPFKAMSYRTVPMEQLPPQIADCVRTGLQQASSRDANAEAGCAVLDCPAINYSLVDIGSVHANISKQVKPQEIPKYLALLNMDAHEALALLANFD